MNDVSRQRQHLTLNWHLFSVHIQCLFDTMLCARSSARIKTHSAMCVDLEYEEMQMTALSGFTDRQKQP